MIANETKPATTQRAVSGRARGVRRAAAAGFVAVLTLGACTSYPSAKRVAEDIIRAETADDPARQECMLTALDQFSDSDLEQITNQFESANEDTQAEGQAALDEYEAALAACD